MNLIFGKNENPEEERPNDRTNGIPRTEVSPALNKKETRFLEARRQSSQTSFADVKLPSCCDTSLFAATKLRQIVQTSLDTFLVSFCFYFCFLFLQTGAVRLLSFEKCYYLF
jgi:hypothetical protein